MGWIKVSEVLAAYIIMLVEPSSYPGLEWLSGISKFSQIIFNIGFLAAFICQKIDIIFFKG